MFGRVSIFIDGSNFYHALREVHGRVDLDFKSFANLFSISSRGVPRTLNPVHCYNSVIDRGRHPNTYAKQQRFFSHLEKITDPAFVIYRGRIDHHGNLEYRCRGCERMVEVTEQKCHYCGRLETLQNSVEKGVDVSLAIDMVSGALNDDYDICLLVSEDSDFVPALKQVMQLGKSTELAVLSSKSRRRGYRLIQTVTWTHYVRADDLTWLY